MGRWARCGLAGLLVAGTWACGGPPPALHLDPGPEGLTVSSEDALQQVIVEDMAGQRLGIRRLPVAVETVTVALRWPAPGSYRVRLRGSSGEERSLQVEVGPQPTLSLAVEAPLGQLARPVEPDAVLPIARWSEGPVVAGLNLNAHQDLILSLQIGDQAAQEISLRAGERRLIQQPLSEDKPVEITVDSGDGPWSFTLLPARLDLEQARQQLRLVEQRFPADATGRADPARPEGRISLPSGWTQSLMRRVGLGFRPRDRWSPWAYMGVVLENEGDTPISVVVSGGVTDALGQPAPAFAPHLRQGSSANGAVTALVQVPAHGRATAALPLFADDALLDAHAAAEGQWRRWLTVTPLGANAALHQRSLPLTVRRGSTVAAAGMLGTLLAALLGAALLGLRGKRWLADIPTSGLMTIALFGSMTFMVSAAGRLLSTVISGLLGPFSVLVSALVDDLFRYTLMATLLTLLPQVGTASLALVTSWLLGGLVFGSFGPADLLSLGSQIAFAESCLWISGITRNRSWLSESATSRWLRLSVAFAFANLMGTASALVLQAVLYRLYFADWFVALVLAGPGLAYVAVACAFAVPFADSMRRVQR